MRAFGVFAIDDHFDDMADTTKGVGFHIKSLVPISGTPRFGSPRRRTADDEGAHGVQRAHRSSRNPKDACDASLLSTHTRRPSPHGAASDCL
jgi:hypothetical protein